MVIALKAASLFTGHKYRILAGTNTIAGGLVAGNGGTVTNNNFVSGDIRLTLGWLGNGTNKRLTTDWAGNANGQDDFCVWCWVTASPGDNQAFFGNSNGAVIGGIQVVRVTPLFGLRAKSAILDSGPSAAVTGFVGVTRSASSGFTLRAAGSNTAVTRSSDGNSSNLMEFFSRGAVGYSSGRYSAIGTGPACNLATLQTILTTYHNGLIA
jgi:hypothetical protein